MERVNVEKSIELEKLEFISHTGVGYVSVISARGIFVFGILLIFGILSFREDLGLIQVIFMIAMFFGLGLLLWIATKNIKDGNKLLRIETGLNKSENRVLIEKGINRMNWKKELDMEDQIRCIEVDDFEFLNYEITFLLRGDKVWFNYRSVRKGTNVKSIFGKEVNLKNQERFENILKEIRNES